MMIAVGGDFTKKMITIKIVLSQKMADKPGLYQKNLPMDTVVVLNILEIKSGSPVD